MRVPIHGAVSSSEVSSPSRVGDNAPLRHPLWAMPALWSYDLKWTFPLRHPNCP